MDLRLQIAAILALCLYGRYLTEAFCPSSECPLFSSSKFEIHFSLDPFKIQPSWRMRRKKRSGAHRSVMKQDFASEPPERTVYAYYMATCVPGMAQTLASELQELGCPNVELSGTSAVYFHVYQPESILHILLWSRTAHKIMELLCRTSEPVYSRDDVYQWIRRTVPVEDLLLNPIRNGRKQKWFTLSVSVTLNNAAYIPSDINHSHYTALNIKNALVDAARELSNDHLESDRPSVDVTDACDVPLVVMLRGMKSMSFDRSRFEDDASPDTTSAGAHVSLFRCIHGVGSLHRRGYRSNIAMHKAALKESTAAGLLYTAGWHKTCQQGAAVLMDPMMGSGTLLLEGAMMAADLAPGLMRIKCGIPGAQSPPILRWNCDDTPDTSIPQPSKMQFLWNSALVDATKRAQRGIESLRERGIRIVGNDMHDSSYELADHAFRQAGLRQLVQLHCSDCADWKPTVSTADLPWTIVTNPPWGVRLNEEMSLSWEALRTFLRGEESVVPKNESNVWILSGNANATKHLGLRRSQSIPLQTGEQNLRWLQYILRESGCSSSDVVSPSKFDDNNQSSQKRYKSAWDDRSELRRSPRNPERNRLNLMSNSRGDRDRRPISNNAMNRIPSSAKRQRPSPRREPPTPTSKAPKSSGGLQNRENEWLI